MIEWWAAQPQPGDMNQMRAQDFPVAQWLRLHFQGRGMALIPD